MIFLKRILDHTLFFPLIIAIWGVFSVLFLEHLPANKGLGWDGLRYALIVQELLNAPSIDNYLVLRVFPSALIHACMDLASIQPTARNIITAFNVLNTISLAISAITLKGVFKHFSFNLRLQLFGFCLIYLNYAVTNFTYYYPVMTDTLCFSISLLMFYFFIKNQIINLLLVTLIGTFTWPTLMIQGLILFLFPYFRDGAVRPISERLKRVFSILSISYMSFLILFFILMGDLDTNVYGVPKIDRDLLFTSILCLAVLYYFLPQLLFNRDFYSFSQFLSKRFLVSAAIAIGIVISLYFFKDWLNIYQRASHYYGIKHQLTTSLAFGLVKPSISLVSHITYFGGSFIIMVILWKSFCKEIHSLGLGFALFLFLNLFFYGLKTESRAILNVFPWISIVCLMMFQKLNVSNLTLIIIVVFNFISSKIWLSINYGSGEGGLDQDGAALFPDQFFFLNFGNRMSENMWLFQLVVFVLTGFIFYFLLKKHINGKSQE
ncbi:hypothetical protein N9R81_03940 [Flavobacteriales bacterium]|nr:hypothetical protein [Flavobacteriales bacterium]